MLHRHFAVLLLVLLIFFLGGQAHLELFRNVSVRIHVFHSLALLDPGKSDPSWNSSLPTFSTNHRLY
jgi:hypothetical protein